ncbi:MAG: hypothetical protein M3Z33_07260 [Actinomycetota bacterium]|nr:hypothetical protein [Actinomycetota bacterium]
MRNELLVVAVLGAGGATAVGVSACGSDSKKTGHVASMTRPATMPATTQATPAAPTTLRVRVAGQAKTVKVADISFSFCRRNPRTCAAVKPAQQARLTGNQRNAIKAAAARVRALDAPVPVPVPAPAPVPEPEPQPQSGGETTTG